MDTRSTKFKYSYFTKGLCIILSALLFFSFAFSAVKTISAALVYGFEEYLTDEVKPFYRSYGFENQLTTDIYYINEIAYTEYSNIKTAFDNNKDSIINETVNMYLTEKAEIIYNELSFAVENYDESYFLYEYTADAIDIPEDVTETLSDSNGEEIPRNIEAAKKVLKNYSGLELLPYAALVRDSAFTEREFSYTSSIQVTPDYQTYITFSSHNGYYLDETEIRKHFLSQFENTKEFEAENNESNHEYAKSTLAKLDSLKYFIIDKNGNIQTNASAEITADSFKTNAKKSQIYLFSDGSGQSLSELSDQMQNNLKQTFIADSESVILLCVDTDALTKGNDYYAYLYKTYNNMISSDAFTNITLTVVSLIISFIILIAFLCLCGHRNNDEETREALIDKLPTDIHFILSFAAIAGLTVLGGWICIILIESTNVFRTTLLYMYAPALIGLIFTLSYLIFTEWISSTVRIKKCGNKFFARMLIAKGIFALVKIFRRIINSIKNLFSALTYKPKKMQRNVILAATGYVLGNFLIIFATQILSTFIYGAICTVIGIFTCIIYNSVTVYFMLEYLKKLDLIIDASSRHESVDFSNERVPESLRILALNLTNTKDALEKAIDKAVRDEQMKTELITNVSHDLKTPLTSLISYSDLLSKCDVKDEDAVKYIGVINNQSIKLKRLIEDLIEASKVSTGNVTINKTKLNLSEFAFQLIAEFAPEMEKNGNEIRFSEPETPPTIMADGAKTYRILSNLLSNAKKYSMPDTRVYISVYTDNINSYFEIKNISAEALNIRPDELTERFVRGDKSRSKEGNGLGLSIAKDLCSLQNGELHLHIDGDLFKAIVALPSAGPLNENIETE